MRMKRNMKSYSVLASVYSTREQPEHLGKVYYAIAAMELKNMRLPKPN